MHRRAMLVLCLLAVGLGTVAAFGQTYNVLYNFGSKANDPYSPQYSGIIAQGRDGNLYTTAPGGGSYGAVFKITPSGTLSIVHSFIGSDGGAPYGGVTLGTDGNFYGTTYQGGTNEAGTVFKMTPAGTVTTLHVFAGTDGSNPYAPPIQGTDGNWYGTTFAGGTSSYGTIYKWTPAGVFTTLLSFDYSNGAKPYGPLVEGSDGNFYGMTEQGGANGYGEVFKITPAGAFTILHSFDVTDGGDPWGPLIQANDGFLYGGATDFGSGGGGVVFKISLAGVFTALHDMNPATNGKTPYEGILQASDGNFYGANGSGGIDSGTANGGYGTIFKMTTKDVVSTLYDFTSTAGALPWVLPVQHTNGILYGDTNSGGSGNVSPCTTGTCGVFYSLNASLPAFVTALPNFGKVGSAIGILGQGFSAASVVEFNGVKATKITLTGTTFIEATIPVGASDGYITVTTGTTTLKTLKKFTVHNSWGSGAAMPVAVVAPAAGYINGKIYVVGGIETTGGTPVTNNQVYNPTTNAWTTAAAIPTGVEAPASAVVSGLLYVIGGYAGAGETQTDLVQIYNPATNTWTTGAAMPTARGSVAAVVDGTAIYVIGGNGATNRLTTVEKYVPSTNTWTEEAPLLTGVSELSAGLLGTTIVAADGYTVSGDEGTTEGYDVSTNTWSALTSDPNPRNASCSGVISGLLYVAGGVDANPSDTETLTVNESFSATGNKWTTLAAMPTAALWQGSAVDSGQLYCFGGWASFRGTAISNVQIYQP